MVHAHNAANTGPPSRAGSAESGNGRGESDKLNIRTIRGENAFALKVIQHDIVEDPDAWSRYLQRPEERLSTGLIYGTLHLQTGGRAVYAQKMIYKEMFFRSHGKIPNWGLPLAKWSAETLMI